MSDKNTVICTLGDQDYFAQIITENMTFYVDEPEAAGGNNKAPNPTAYLLGALASCTAITMRMYTQRKGWDAGQIKVFAKLRERITQEGIKKIITKEVVFEKELTEQQQQRILKIGARCPISKMLEGATEMEMRVVEKIEKSIVKTYENEDIEVIWKPGLCIHSKKCWKEMSSVFNPNKKPWVNIEGASSEKIVDQINRCPSGALSYKLKNKKNDQA